MDDCRQEDKMSKKSLEKLHRILNKNDTMVVAMS